jgi:hypothetical protein
MPHQAKAGNSLTLGDLIGRHLNVAYRDQTGQAKAEEILYALQANGLTGTSDFVKAALHERDVLRSSEQHEAMAKSAISHYPTRAARDQRMQGNAVRLFAAVHCMDNFWAINAYLRATNYQVHVPLPNTRRCQRDVSISARALRTNIAHRLLSAKGINAMITLGAP